MFMVIKWGCGVTFDGRGNFFKIYSWLRVKSLAINNGSLRAVDGFGFSMRDG